MEKREFKVHVAPDTILAAKSAGIKLVVPETNTIIVEVNSTAIPDRTGIYVGKGEGDSMESNIVNDDDCRRLSRYIEFGLVETKVFCQRIDNELCNVPHYFFMYEIDDSLANRPTYTEDHCGEGTPITGHYECEYEILLASEEYTRRMLFKTSSVNISMYEWLKDLESELEDLDEADDEIKEQFIKLKDDDDDDFEEDDWVFTMFDNVGLATDVPFEIDTFLSMIVSVRQLSCKFVDSKVPNI